MSIVFLFTLLIIRKITHHQKNSLARYYLFFANNIEKHKRTKGSYTISIYRGLILSSQEYSFYKQLFIKRVRRR